MATNSYTTSEERNRRALPSPCSSAERSLTVAESQRFDGERHTSNSVFIQPLSVMFKTVESLARRGISAKVGQLVICECFDGRYYLIVRDVIHVATGVLVHTTLPFSSLILPLNAPGAKHPFTSSLSRTRTQRSIYWANCAVLQGPMFGLYTSPLHPMKEIIRSLSSGSAFNHVATRSGLYEMNLAVCQKITRASLRV